MSPPAAVLKRHAPPTSTIVHCSGWRPRRTKHLPGNVELTAANREREERGAVLVQRGGSHGRPLHLQALLVRRLPQRHR